MLDKKSIIYYARYIEHNIYGGYVMKFCQNCGKEIIEGAKFCNSCGSPVEAVEPQVEGEKETTEIDLASQETEVAEGVSADLPQTDNVDTNSEAIVPVKSKKQIKMTKTTWIIVAAVAVAIVIAIVSIVNSVKLNNYKTILENAYSSMSYGAEQAESYCSLQSKVWRNCIMQDSSIETDKYTKNEYGSYYSDFNDALEKFYTGEYLTHSTVSSNVDTVNGYMSELKDCPEKFEDEYRALKEMYVAYSDLTDLVVGSSSYSLNTFSEALESAKADYKSALSSAKLLLE